MPSHYDKGDYDSRDAGGGARYSSRGRGRGRGNYAWGGRVGNSSSSGGGRGYGRGGASGGSSSSGGSRYRGGGGHGVASSSYRDNTTSYHDRYSDSRRTGGHMVNPWDAGMGPREVGGGGGYGAHASAFGAAGMGMGSSGGGGGGAGTSQLIGSLNQLSQMGNDKSKLALNILNAVLSSDSAMGEGRDVWEHGPPPRKMRRMEWDELRPPPARRYPPRYSPRRTWDRRGGPSYPRGDHHSGSTDYQARRVAKARRGKPWHDTRSGKGPGREGRAKEEQDLSDDLDRESTAAAAGTSAAQAPQSEEKMEEDEGKEETEASSQGKAEGKTDVEEDKEGKEGEEGAAAGKSDDKQEEKKDKDTDMVKQNESGEITWLPREALQCHMCGLSKFPDIKSYMRHLESRRHETLKYSFHAKGAAILHFLRANSKLASQRKMLKSLRRGIKGPIMRCRKCQCEVFGYIREHAKTVEHIALRNYLRVVCCNTTFFNRADLEEHRLSLIHLKNQLEEEQKRQKMEAENEVDDIGVEESEDGKLFADTIKHMKQKTKFAEVTSPENLMPYDPATPQGLNFIWKRSHYRCKACPQVRLTSAADTEEHFKSLDHYNNLMAHLKAIEEEKEKKRLEEEEAARKAEMERKKKEEAEAKAAEEGEGGEGDGNKEEESRGKEAGDEEAEKEENDDSKKNGDVEGEEDEDLDEEEEEATAATRTAEEEEEEEEEEETSFNFEEDMHNMETVDEACDDGEMEGGLEGSLAEDDEGREDSGVGGVAAEELFADISCLAEVGEELDEVGKEKTSEPKKEEKVKEEMKAAAEEEKTKVKESDKAEPKEKMPIKKEDEDPVESIKKESVKREREEDDEPVATVVVEGRGRGSGRGSGTPRGRRGRGRGRARSVRN